MSSAPLFRPLVEGIIQALDEIFNQSRHADKVIEKQMKAHRKWGGRDRRFFAESVYDITRWWRRLLYALEQGEFGAHVNMRDAVSGYILTRWPNDIPDWLAWPQARTEHFLNRWRDDRAPRAVIESIPDWLDQMGAEQLGDRWPAILHALNQPAPAFLRANALKSSVSELKAKLSGEDVGAEPVKGSPWALKLVKRVNAFRTDAFSQGLFEMQDGGSQQLAPLLQPVPGERIVDACAGAGGKTLHLAALMKNKGRIIAMDIHQWKLDELRKRTSRAGVDIVEARVIDSSKVIKRMHETADGVLLDVPCSGTGVLRRNPDSKWKLSAEELERLAKLQAELLQDYSMMTKHGGRLVYATCSIFPKENEHQVQGFLKSAAGQGWRLEEEIHVWPDQTEFDGFYGARLRRS